MAINGGSWLSPGPSARFGPAADGVVPDLTQALRKSVAARGASDEWLWIIADSLFRSPRARLKATRQSPRYGLSPFP